MHVCICDCVSMYAYMHLCMFKLYTCLHHCTAIMRTNSKSLCVCICWCMCACSKMVSDGDGRQPNAPQQGFLFLSAIAVLRSMYMYKSNWSTTSWYYDCSTTNIALVHSTYIYKILSSLFRHCDVRTPLMMCACARACDCTRNHITTTETIAVLLLKTPPFMFRHCDVEPPLPCTCARACVIAEEIVSQIRQMALHASSTCTRCNTPPSSTMLVIVCVCVRVCVCV